MTEAARKYYLKNKDVVIARSREWAKRNREKRLLICKKSYWKHHAKELARSRKRSKTHSKQTLERLKRWQRNARKNNPQFRIKTVLRCRLTHALRGGKGVKHLKTLELLGCSLSDFRIYLESKFEAGMSWENYGKWHIDHIIPCALFDLTKPEHQKRCFHFSNMQPMWAKENHRKGHSIRTNQFNLL